MSDFFKTSTLWIVDFRFDGRPRRWHRAWPAGTTGVEARMAEELRQLHGGRAALEAVRPATADEEAAYLRGEVAPPALCPTGRRGA